MFENRPRVDHILGNVEFHRADRSRCPVCSHPTGDCTGDLDPPDHIVGLTMAKTEQDLVLVKDDVYVEKRISKHANTKVLAARKGQMIPRERAKELGLL